MANITTPIGRLVYGDPARRFPITDDHGRPKMQADGQTPATEISFGLAIPKGPEQHWAETEWGSVIWQEGMNGFRNGEFNMPAFSWKIVDGDSQIPNRKGNKPCDKEGYPGHWVLSFSTRFDIKLFDYIHGQGGEIFEEGVIKNGHYVQVYADVKPNNENNPNVQSPGVYLNPVYVAHSAYGPVIATSSGPDVATVGFGGGQLPPGASKTPIGGGFNPAGPQGNAPQGGPGTYAPPQSQSHGHAAPPANGPKGGYNPNAAHHAPQTGHAAPSANGPQGHAPAASSAGQGNGPQANYQFANGPRQ